MNAHLLTKRLYTTILVIYYYHGVQSLFYSSDALSFLAWEWVRKGVSLVAVFSNNVSRQKLTGLARTYCDLVIAKGQRQY